MSAKGPTLSELMATNPAIAEWFKATPTMDEILVQDARRDERGKIVEWLRMKVGPHDNDEDFYSLGELSNEIERGDYEK